MGLAEPLKPYSTTTAARPGSPPAGIIRRFTRGKESPQGVVWFGARTFWGHIRHFIASAIATESIDSRDWMTPDEPDALVRRIAEVLGGKNPTAPTLIEALGRDLYIDFVADTGDDVAVSRAVARLVFAPYEVPDPDLPGEFLLAPRGEILFFGGDTAYPVATAEELGNRVIAPWNQVLRALPPDGQRVLLGVPGNHDWYDGLDGFCRMFRRCLPDTAVRPRVHRFLRMPIEHYAEWAQEFVRGGKIEKPKALVLSGYRTVQNASYFALPLAPAIDLLAVDRQLTTTDSRQTTLLGAYYRNHPDSATLAVLPDPVYAFGEPSKTGTEMVESLQLDLTNRETFVLSGDIHHYERIERGKALHVVAGGGGAFLHPARIAEGGLSPTVVWPGVKQCRKLLAEVPLKLALGRSGYLPHLGLLLLYLLAYFFSRKLLAYTGLVISSSVVMTILIAGIYSLIGGVTRRRLVLPFAFIAAMITVLLPIGGSVFLNAGLERLGESASLAFVGVVTVAVGVFAGAFVFGCYLSLLTVLGYENMQAFTALDHPGFKHFLRLRVRADGSGIDGWCIGAADPLGEAKHPVLVDHFSWRPFRK
jgi:hypothetical protein